MKIVINKCFGGFGLSHKAKMEFFKRKNINVFPYVQYWSWNSDESYTRYTGHTLSTLDFISYFKKDPKIDKVSGTYNEVEQLYGIADVSSFLDDSNRTDEDLIAVVEKLGSEASDCYANLKIVEIPDDFEYRIHEYDGLETVYYGLKMGSA